MAPRRGSLALTRSECQSYGVNRQAPSSPDRYGTDVLSGDWRRGSRPRSTPTVAETGLVVEEVSSGWVGAVTRTEKSGGVHVVVLEDRHGRTRTFPLGPGFLIDGAPVLLTAPTGPARPAPKTRTASGSVAVHGAKARVARGSRILVEGKHDAELVEKVWGDDLRIEGVVVEMLDGVDDLEGAICDFAPEPGRRLGILVDHLVPGTKESSIVEQARGLRGFAAHTLILGHPYVDVWQSVRPERLGLDAWPVIPKGTSWKTGICRHLGWPHETVADQARAWQRILGAVRSYADLEPSLLASVEELIDFVTAPGT